MSYILEFRDETEHDELLNKLNKAKKALSEVCEMMEEAEVGENTMSERGMYRDEMNYRRGVSRYRGGGRYGY